MAADRSKSRLGNTIDLGAVTAEYLVGTVAAASFAAVLLQLIRSPYMHGVVWMIFQKAFGLDWW